MSGPSWNDMTPEQRLELLRNPWFDVVMPILFCAVFVAAMLILMTYIPRDPPSPHHLHKQQSNKPEAGEEG